MKNHLSEQKIDSVSEFPFIIGNIAIIRSILHKSIEIINDVPTVLVSIFAVLINLSEPVEDEEEDVGDKQG